MTYIDEIAFDIYAEAERPEVPPVKEHPLYRMYAVLALSKGRGTTLKDVHDAWVAWVSDHNPGHRSAIPFNQLTPDVQELDRKYMHAIHVVASRL